MITRIHPIPAFTDNYIWALSDSTANRLCVVDPGDADPVIRYVESIGATLTDILITHHHPDHTGGIKELSTRYQPRIIGPQAGNTAGISEHVSEGDQVELFDHVFSVLEIPGHTLDHIAYFSDSGADSAPLLFCGDTLFAGGCGRIFEGTAPQMFQSLGKLTELSDKTKVYCTHEYTMANLKFAAVADPKNQALQLRIHQEQEKRNNEKPTLPSTLNLEFATNPFLRCTETDIINSVSAYCGMGLNSETEVFTNLRAWKDNF